MADIQERIAAARKEAEALKDKIKIKKDALADTTCTASLFSLRIPFSPLFLGDQMVTAEKRVGLGAPH